MSQSLPFHRRVRRLGVRTREAVFQRSRQNAIIVIALIVLLFLFYLLNPNFLNEYNIISMAQSMAPYAIMGLGVTFAIATGGIDLSIGTVCIAASVVAGKLYTSEVIPLWATIPVMIGIGAIFGIANGFLIAKLKLPAFIATLGTMMISRGLSAILVNAPNIFYPTGTWFNRFFSNYNGFPVGLVWVFAFLLLCMYLMYKNKIGRYILSVGSNEEATRLSGINTDAYKMTAYLLTGIGAGVAAIFWSASFVTVASATGNGMELDAIAGVYIGGTSAAGGTASVGGSVIGAAMLVVIRSGLNFVLAKYNVSVNSTYVTYVLTGVIVVVSVLIDILKNRNSSRVRIDSPQQQAKKQYRASIAAWNDRLDEVYSDATLSDTERQTKIREITAEIEKCKASRRGENAAPTTTSQEDSHEENK